MAVASSPPLSPNIWDRGMATKLYKTGVFLKK